VSDVRTHERSNEAVLQLTVNGESRSIADGARVADLVSDLNLDGRKIAVERNLEIVPRSQYAGTALQDGDRIEIVAFVGGG
jgi:thiamine biosynthesis protein ThiS